MPQQDTVSTALAGAKNELAKANNLEKSADPTGAQKPKPITMPKAPVSAKAGAGLGDELKAKQNTVMEYANANAVPKLHKGGTIKGDGLHVVNLEKGETVEVHPKGEKMADEKEMKSEKAAEPKKEKKASPAALMTSEDKGAKPKGEKKDAKSKGGFTETHIQHHSHGGHTVKHKHKDNPDKDVAYSAQDMEGVKAGLDQHIGGGAGQMQEAPEPMPNAEQAAAAAPPAGGAPQAAMPQQV